MAESGGKTYIFRGLPLTSDSRTTRYGFLLGSVTYCTWEKKDISSVTGVSHIIAPISKDGALFYLRYLTYLFYLFLFGLLKIRKGDVCICMDLDTFIPIWFSSRFKKNFVAFDVVDPASQARFKKIPLPRAIDALECFFLDRADLCIFPHESRLSYYHDSDSHIFKRKSLVIENVPIVDSRSTSSPRVGEDVVIGYFGTLDSSRGLDALLNFAASNKHIVRLLIAGDGPESATIMRAAKRHKNITYTGRYVPSDLENLYSQVDFSWAYYDPALKLHKYAAPNKFYEHLCFNCPIIVNDIIPQSFFVQKHETGIVASEVEVADMRSGGNKFVERVKNFQRKDIYSMWDKFYAGYYDAKKVELTSKIKSTRK